MNIDRYLKVQENILGFNFLFSLLISKQPTYFNFIIKTTISLFYFVSCFLRLVQEMTKTNFLYAPISIKILDNKEQSETKVAVL
jgi:hypothetical protein